MSETMIERVARIVAIDMYDQWHRADEFTLEEVNGDGLDRATHLACRMIAEMREPSQHMIDEGLGHTGIAAYQDAIDAALSEGRE